VLHLALVIRALSFLSVSSPNPDVATITLRKVTLRLIPFLFLLYIVAWLDRVNVGFSALQMNSKLGFSSAAFGFGSGVFFLGYCLCEVPSNLILHRVGARRWIARIMMSWGAISVAMMFIQSTSAFYTLRFLLGAAEAGFFPGVVYYLSHWYPEAQRARDRGVYDSGSGKWCYWWAFVRCAAKTERSIRARGMAVAVFG